MSLSIRTAAMLVSQTNPPGIELYFSVKYFLLLWLKNMLTDHVSENTLFVTNTLLFEIEAKVNSKIANYQPFLYFTFQWDTEPLEKRAREDCTRPSVYLVFPALSQCFYIHSFYMFKLVNDSREVQTSFPS